MVGFIFTLASTWVMTYRVPAVSNDFTFFDYLAVKRGFDVNRYVCVPFTVPSGLAWQKIIPMQPNLSEPLAKTRLPIYLASRHNLRDIVAGALRIYIGLDYSAAC